MRFIIFPSPIRQVNCNPRIHRRVMNSYRLADAHCHAQLDRVHERLTDHCHAVALAAMSVGGDWMKTTSLFNAYPSRIIRNYGIHPWTCHKYGMDKGDTLRSILSPMNISLGAGVDKELDTSWKKELRDILIENPDACIGECGLDRAATIREEGFDLQGKKAMVTIQHQLGILRYHLQLAAELKRPISLHCVRASGHMEALLRSFSSNHPPCIMMHSFGGSEESIRSLTSIPMIGKRIYFSFSSTINVKENDEPGRQSSKLLGRMKAVADDRILIESDQDDIGLIDGALEEALKMVAEAKGWTIVGAAEQCLKNFNEYYSRPPN